MKTSTTNLVVKEVDAESLHAGNVDEVDAPTQETEKSVQILKKSEMQIEIRSESPKLSDKCRKTLRLSSKQIVSISYFLLHSLCFVIIIAWFVFLILLSVLIQSAQVPLNPHQETLIKVPLNKEKFFS